MALGPSNTAPVTAILPLASRRRLTSLYLASSAFAATGMVAAVTISAVAAERMLGTASWSGLPMASSILGTAIGSQVVGRGLEHFSLRQVLASQYALSLLGGGLAAVAVVQGRFALLVVGLVALGLGNGATQYLRYLAGDLFSPERRAQVLSWVVWMSGVGAVIGPSLLAPSGRWATLLGQPEEAGPYLAAMVAFSLCALAFATLPPRGRHADIYPNAGADNHRDGPRKGGAYSHALGQVATWPRAAKLALVAMVVSHVVMVFVMTMTPIHLTHHGHNLGAVGVVISAHMAGMFLFAPIAGWLCNKVSAPAVLFAGSMILAFACLLAGLGGASLGDTGLSGHMPMPVPLFLLGLGWNFGFVSGSTVLTNNLPDRLKIRGRAFADACVWTAAAISSLASSLLFSRIGFAQLSWVGCALAVALAVLLASTARRPRKLASP